MAVTKSITNHHKKNDLFTALSPKRAAGLAGLVLFIFLTIIYGLTSILQSLSVASALLIGLGLLNFLMLAGYLDQITSKVSRERQGLKTGILPVQIVGMDLTNRKTDFNFTFSFLNKTNAALLIYAACLLPVTSALIYFDQRAGYGVSGQNFLSWSDVTILLLYAQAYILGSLSVIPEPFRRAKAPIMICIGTAILLDVILIGPALTSLNLFYFLVNGVWVIIPLTVLLVYFFRYKNRPYLCQTTKRRGAILSFLAMMFALTVPSAQMPFLWLAVLFSLGGFQKYAHYYARKHYKMHTK